MNRSENGFSQPDEDLLEQITIGITDSTEQSEPDRLFTQL